jgi:hypothetical protein
MMTGTTLRDTDTNLHIRNQVYEAKIANRVAGICISRRRADCPLAGQGFVEGVFWESTAL